MSVAIEDIRRMSVTERLKLLDDIWESLLDDQDALPLSEAQALEIDRRRLAYQKRGDQGISWEELDQQLSAE